MAEIEKHPKYDDYDYPTTAPVKQSGHPGHTDKQQDAQVFMLRSQLEQAGYTERLDTLSMLRFLRARKFNVEHAKKMYVAPPHNPSLQHQMRRRLTTWSFWKRGDDRC